MKDNNENVAIAGLSAKQWFIYKLFISSDYRWLRHLFIFILFYFIFAVGSGKKEYKGNIDLIAGSLFVICLLSSLYFNMYILVPRFLNRTYLHWYVLGVLATGLIAFLLVCIADELLNEYRLVTKARPKENPITSMIVFLIFFSIFITSSTAVKLFQNWMKSLEKLYNLQKVNFQHELGLLKSQINPHFLFNTLNSVHILIENEPKRASDMILNLSDLLRYQIYDCTEEQVFLSSDISFLKDFLALESSRRDDFNYEIKQSGEHKDVMIAPMLFIPFVENAIKHNHDTQASFIRINIHFQNKELTFSCLNSKPMISPKTALSDHGGIGLPNIQRRLNILYPDRHTLSIQELTDTFYINLKLKL